MVLRVIQPGRQKVRHAYRLTDIIISTDVLITGH